MDISTDNVVLDGSFKPLEQVMPQNTCPLHVYLTVVTASPPPTGLPSTAPLGISLGNSSSRCYVHVKHS